MKTLFFLCAIAALLSPVYGATLVASYSFEGNTNDSSGFGNHASNSGANFINDGISGQAMRFDGNDFLRASDSPSLDIAGSFTLSAWVRTTVANPSFSGLVTKHFTHNNRSYGLFLNEQNGSYVQFDNAGNTDFFTEDRPVTATIDDGEWHHVVGTYNQATGQMKIFADGNLLQTDNVGSHTLMNSSVPLLIGAYALSNNGLTNRAFLTGDLDEIQVYDGALSDSEVAALHSSLTVPEANGMYMAFMGLLVSCLMKARNK